MSKSIKIFIPNKNKMKLDYQKYSKSFNNKEAIIIDNTNIFFTPFKIKPRFSEILNKKFFSVDCLNGCFCEFDNLEDAEKKIYELYYRLIISNENNINEFFYIKDKRKFLITKKLIKEKFKNKNIIYFTNYKKYNYLDILLKIINEK